MLQLLISFAQFLLSEQYKSMYSHLQKDRMNIPAKKTQNNWFIVIYIVFGQIITFGKYSILL
jgi:hypothetical protein